jgi:hypothetical protein
MNMMQTIEMIIREYGIRVSPLTRAELIRMALQRDGCLGCLDAGSAALCGRHNRFPLSCF